MIALQFTKGNLLVLRMQVNSSASSKITKSKAYSPHPRPCVRVSFKFSYQITIVMQFLALLLGTFIFLNFIFLEFSNDSVGVLHLNHL